MDNDDQANEMEWMELAQDYSSHLEETYYPNRLINLLQLEQEEKSCVILATAKDGDVLSNAFVCAGIKNHVQVLQSFLHHGMNVDIKNKFGCTALIVASINGKAEAVQLLLDHNADVNIMDDIGDTALIYAAGGRYVKIVEMLLQHNAFPDIQNTRGKTALMHAAKSGNQEVVSLLLSYGADAGLKSDKGKVARNYAVYNNAVFELLKNHVPVGSAYILK